LIPARLASVRLPNKPLVPIGDWPMIRHVWEQTRKCGHLESVFITTPDVQIAEAAREFGAGVVMTSDRHRSGTDRLAEAAQILGLAASDIVVNVQGDEPLLDPRSIDAAVAPLIEDPTLLMSSLMCVCPELDLDNPACVKVVCAPSGDALYFSRARVPFHRSAEPVVPVMQHVGLYAYRRSFLAEFAALAPTPLERTELLEQLRVLENGVRIRMVRIESAPIGVDTPEDLERVRRILAPRD
jgi:3-deoxy-manno-octulosonate cytidylyltransferase (CMP-KDO synthetase)